MSASTPWGAEATGSMLQTILGKRLKLEAGSAIALHWGQLGQKGGIVLGVGVVRATGNMVPIGNIVKRADPSRNQASVSACPEAPSSTSRPGTSIQGDDHPRVPLVISPTPIICFPTNRQLHQAGPAAERRGLEGPRTTLNFCRVTWILRWHAERSSPIVEMSPAVSQSSPVVETSTTAIDTSKIVGWGVDADPENDRPILIATGRATHHSGQGSAQPSGCPTSIAQSSSTSSFPRFSAPPARQVGQRRVRRLAFRGPSPTGRTG